MHGLKSQCHSPLSWSYSWSATLGDAGPSLIPFELKSQTVRALAKASPHNHGRAGLCTHPGQSDGTPARHLAFLYLLSSSIRRDKMLNKCNTSYPFRFVVQYLKTGIENTSLYYIHVYAVIFSSLNNYEKVSN